MQLIFLRVIKSVEHRYLMCLNKERDSLKRALKFATFGEKVIIEHPSMIEVLY